MKAFLKLTLLLMTLIVFHSCISEKYPADKLDPSNYFKTEQDLAIYTNSFYNQFPQGEQIFMKDGNLSDYFAVSTSPPLLLYGNYTSNEREVEQWWSWESLRNINYFLENNKNSAIPEETRDHYNGIARLFRAYFYFEKVKTFGDVPWYENPLSTSDPELYKKRDSRLYVMEKVLEDLDYAVEKIRPTKNNSSTAITKWTALALKSRITLFEGTFRKYSGLAELNSDYARFLLEALSSANKLIIESGYSLNKAGTTPYRDLFVSENPITSEIILADIYSTTLARFHNANWLFTSSSTGSRPGLTRTFINTFLNIDGSRFTDNPDYNNISFPQETNNRDARLAQIIRTPEYRLLGNRVSPDFGHTKTGYHFIKYTQDSNPNLAMARNTNSLPLIRYAEVLLNYAEAAAELGQMNDIIWNQTIGALRERAGIQNTSRPLTTDTYMADLFPGITDSDILEVRRERAIELVGEGFRFDDLRRWKAGHLLERPWDGIVVPATGVMYDMNSDGTFDVCFVSSVPTNPVTGVFYYNLSPTNKLENGTSGKIIVYGNVNKSFSDFKYLYPIPESQLIINNNLIQNPGWE